VARLWQAQSKAEQASCRCTGPDGDRSDCVDNHYDILGVWRDASADEIEQRYQSLRNRLEDELEFDEGVTARLRAVETARAVLIEPAQRAAYDELLKAPDPPDGDAVQSSELERSAPNDPLGDLPEKARKHVELNEGEEAIAVINGAGKQAIVATQTRLIIVKPGWRASSAFGAKVTSFEYRNITAIEMNKKLTTGVIEVIAAGYQGIRGVDWGGKNGESAFDAANCLPVIRAQADAAEPALAVIRERVAQAHDSPASASPTNGVADELAKLAELRQQGVLSPEEFGLLKHRLIS
jgi:curved DNA-binding protein CbpA